uniref:Uncharacterized protein n=1 Tax=Poecilia mexicana TaxID=48701 RepID=A0A3B3WRH6_9TELE
MSRVILASRYGTCGLLQPLPRRLRPRSERARITLPRASRPVLMILLARSEPARSTRQSLDERTVFKERLEAFPISTAPSSSSADVTTISLAPITTENTVKKRK